MSIQYPSHLYVRVDRGLRADLLAAAEARGVGVSETARALLRKALSSGGAGAGEDDEAVSRRRLDHPAQSNSYQRLLRDPGEVIPKPEGV